MFRWRRDLMRPRSGSTCHHMPTPCLNPRGALVTPSHRRSRARHLAYRSTALSRSRLNRRGHCATSFRSHTLTPQSSQENAHSSACRAVVVPGSQIVHHSSQLIVLTQMFSHKVFTVIFSYRVQTMVMWEHQHITQILDTRSSMCEHEVNFGKRVSSRCPSFAVR